MIGKHFDSLGLPHTASEEEVRKRYRELVKMVHPDVNDSEDAHHQFVNLTEAYNALLEYFEREEITIDVNYVEVEENSSSVEDDWIAYRKHAEEQYKIRKEKEKIEHEKWFQLLRSGWRLIHFKVAFTVSSIVFLATLADWILPFRYNPEVTKTFSMESFNSLPPNKVSLIQTRSGHDYWLANYNPSYFNEQPFFQVKSTSILHQPVSVVLNYQASIDEIPIHFTVYWAQIILFPIVLIPLFAFYYRKNDAFFIFLNIFARFISLPLIVLMLLTDNRWLHLLTLGFY